VAGRGTVAPWAAKIDTLIISRTLGQFVNSKVALVAICRRCKHRRVLYPANSLNASTRIARQSSYANIYAAAAAAAIWLTSRIRTLMPCPYREEPPGCRRVDLNGDEHAEGPRH